jgi:hypothetical protein
MKRYGLLVTTAFTALLTGLVLHRAGWCSPVARAAGVTRTARTAPTLTPAAYHYRQGTPTHWHDCMLQH